MSPRPSSGANRAAHGLVLRSVNGPGATHCVDLFRRTDGSLGFEVYRRDPEDSHGWFAIGAFATIVYATGADAWQSALRRVDWLCACDSSPA